MWHALGHYRKLLTLCCGVACVFAGCSRYVEDKWSRARPGTYRVSGLVLRDDRPVEGALVTFLGRMESGDELSAVGLTDVKGRFELKTYRPGDGAIAGNHRVAIEKRSLAGGESDSDKAFASQQEYEAQRSAVTSQPKLISEVPGKYASFDTSGLTAEVSEKGPNEFVFMLDGTGLRPKGSR